MIGKIGTLEVEMTTTQVDWQFLAALLPDHPGLREAAKRDADEARFRTEIRDYIRHQWRIETGQIPWHAGMASSWGGVDRWLRFGERR